jgi:polygalacturonase
MTIKIVSVILLFLLAGTNCFSQASVKQSSAYEGEWAKVPQILARIKAPVFSDKKFDITQYGAVADGQTDASPAIAKAIDACNKAGGGVVIVPKGDFLTGPITLKSNVNLHVEKDAVLKFKTETKAYLPAVLTTFEGMECYNYSPFIYALNATNIAITGEGTLDGQCSDSIWWFWKYPIKGKRLQEAARARLMKMVDDNMPVSERRFGEGDYLRPYFIAPVRCNNILIEGVKIRRSPMWEVSPQLCNNITIRKVNIESLGPNNDGVDPEYCHDVLIEDCYFDTGDDCIAIKAGRNNDGRRVGVSAENIIVRGCTMKNGHGGIVIGSEISGGCRNIFVENCIMNSPNLDRVLRLKSNAKRGATIENVFVRNIKVGQVRDAILQIDFQYEEGANGQYKTAARNIIMENITSEQTPRIFNIAGLPGHEISNVRVINSTFLNVKKPDYIVETNDVKLENCVVKK